MFRAWKSSEITIGPISMLGNRTVDPPVWLWAVIFQFHHGITPTVIGESGIVVVSIMRVIVVVTVTDPSVVIVVVLGKAISKGVMNGPGWRVVGLFRVRGGKITFIGPIPVTVLSWGPKISWPTRKSPVPSLPPSGLAPSIDVSTESKSLGFPNDPGPPRSNAQLKSPPRHLPLAKSAFCLSVFALSNDTLYKKC